MKLSHNGTTYTIERSALCTVFIHLPGRSNPAKLFAFVPSGRVTRQTIIDELDNRADQRRSAVNNTLHLKGAI